MQQPITYRNLICQRGHQCHSLRDFVVVALDRRFFELVGLEFSERDPELKQFVRVDAMPSHSPLYPAQICQRDRLRHHPAIVLDDRAVTIDPRHL